MPSRDRARNIRVAIDRLILEQYATAVEGPRGAKLVQLAHPYVEAEDDHGERLAA